MITLFSMPNVTRFLQMIQSAAGQVLLHLSDDTAVDLKEDRTAREMLRSMRPGDRGLRFSLSDASDIPEFTRFIAQAAR